MHRLLCVCRAINVYTVGQALGLLRPLRPHGAGLGARLGAPRSLRGCPTRTLSFAVFCILCLPCANGQPRDHDYTSAEIEGDVIDVSNGKPITNARIKLDRGEREPIYLRVDERGHFKVTDAAPSHYELTVKAPGYTDMFRVGLDSSLGRRPAGCGATKNNPPASAGLTATSCEAGGILHVSATVGLTPYAVVMGKVTDPYGLPLAGWTVEAVTAPAASDDARNNVLPRFSTETNEKGEYRIAHLSPAAYYIVTVLNRMQGEVTYRQTYYPGVTNMEGAKSLVLTPGEQAHADLRIVEQRGVRVAGRIIKPEGADEKRSIHVVLAPETDDLSAAGRPSASGVEDYHMAEVLPGKYILMAGVRDRGDLRPDAKDLFGALRHIEVGEQDMDGVDITLAPLHDIEGAVTFQDGCSPVPVHIQGHTRGLDVTRVVEADADRDGRFVLHGMSTGRYTFFISGHVDSMMLGSRDVAKDGLESPYEGSDVLQITLGCSNSGRRP